MIYLQWGLEKRQIGVQKKDLASNPKVINPLVGKLPRFYGQLDIARSNLNQLEKKAAHYTSPDQIPQDLDLKISKERALISKLERDIAAIEASVEGD